MIKNYKDNTFLTDENTIFSFSIVSVIGNREEQQDCFGYSLHADEGIIAICDGMGGHAGGQRASNTAISRILDGYDSEYPVQNPEEFLRRKINEIDTEIKGFLTEDGTALNAGTTIVCVLINGSHLYWISVGDSRLYLFRAGELVQVTQDHIYQVVLEGKLQSGEISPTEYAREEEKGEALISFLGIGDVQLIDNNTVPFRLRSGDKLLLASDGLYKIVPEDEIQMLLSNFNNISEALQALNMKAGKIAEKQKIKRDNLTASLIQIK